MYVTEPTVTMLGMAHILLRIATDTRQTDLLHHIQNETKNK